MARQGSNTTPFTAQELFNARKTLVEHQKNLKRRKGVVSVGIGCKQIDNKYAQQRGDKKEVLAIVVYVKEKPYFAGEPETRKEKDALFKKYYPRQKLIPKTLGKAKIPTDVRVIRRAKFANQGGDKIIRDNILPGPEGSGTLGIILQHGGSHIGLTNAHIAFDTVDSLISREIFDFQDQIRIGDNGKNGFDIAGHDCATVDIDPGIPVQIKTVANKPVIFDKNNTSATEQQKVELHGVNTPDGRGVIKQTDSVAVEVGSEIFIDCMEIESASSTPFGIGGDSGAVVIAEQDQRVVGLFFAFDVGNPQIGYAVRLRNVIKALGL